MRKKETWISLNSAIVFATAFLLTTILHESFHALAGLLCESKPVLHHNYVEYLAEENLSISQQVLVTLAGPLFSLVQGTLAAWLFVEREVNSIFDYRFKIVASYFSKHIKELSKSA